MGISLYFIVIASHALLCLWDRKLKSIRWDKKSKTKKNCKAKKKLFGHQTSTCNANLIYFALQNTTINLFKCKRNWQAFRFRLSSTIVSWVPVVKLKRKKTKAARSNVKTEMITAIVINVSCHMAYRHLLPSGLTDRCMMKKRHNYLLQH